MTARFKYFLLVFLALMAAFAPEIASAANAAPPGKTDWDLYVFGNGRVIFDILNGIKMLMVPDVGQTGFKTLLLVMATLGFLVLAIAAGFDPGKNLIKMFSYILVVWGVTFASTTLTANVVIQDMARDPSTMASGSPDFRVSNAPAIVVLPAAMTSLVGKYFTTIMETYFTLPGELKMSGQAVGQFNLFGRMMQAATQYVITSPELKKSLSAYAADCVVPSMALGRLSGPVMGADGKPTTAYGNEALLRTTDMVVTLGSAASPGLLTKYFPYSVKDTNWKTRAGSELTGIGSDDVSLKQASANGVLLSCKSSYDNLVVDIASHANELLAGGSAAWARTGVMVPFETAFSTMLGQAAGRGSTAAGFSSPNGFIMQQSMINQMNGSFRQAAIQTGNNEMMQAAAMSQAEQTQKSTWAAAFSVFNNMMGYVFTVLQAFIFALTPLIIIALMIPGMGSKIFVNYAQILVWLTLWQPMLSLINFIITLFGAESLSTVVNLEGGLSPTNSGLLTSKTNDLMIAAQFLGTMTPLLSWGIVKGAMAFTEFINQGIGSAVASQAGAAAATGNLSMNNLSMDNASMNKYSTMSSSAVGNQGVSVGANAGSLDVAQNAGGSNMMMNSAQVAAGRAKIENLSSQKAEAVAMASAMQEMSSKGMSESTARTWAASKGEGSVQARAFAKVSAATDAASISQGTGKSMSVTEQGANSKRSSAEVQAADASAAKGSAGLSSPIPGLNIAAGVEASRTMKNARSDGNEAGLTNTGATASTAEKDKFSSSKGASESVSATTSNASSNSSDKSEKASHDRSESWSKALQQSTSSSTTLSNTLTSALSTGTSFGFSETMSMAEYNSQLSQLDAIEGKFRAGVSAMETREAAMMAGLSGKTEAFNSEFSSRQGESRAALSSLSGGAGGNGPGNSSVFAAGVGGSIGATNDAIKAGHASVDAENNKIQTRRKAMQDVGLDPNQKNNPFNLPSVNRGVDASGAKPTRSASGRLSGIMNPNSN